MTTIKAPPHQNPQVAAVISGRLRVSETHANARNIGNWYTQRLGLEFSITGRNGRSFLITVQRKDPGLFIAPVILRSEPRSHRPADRPRTWECGVGFGSRYQYLTGFRTKIECTLAARGWFIAYGVSPDSPGGWL